jgi:uncharacterized damage-inducible protein DinB
MTDSILVKLIEHNNWANLCILEACEALSDEQLDHQPDSAVRGTIRETVCHLVTSQEDYVWMLTNFDHPPEREAEPTLAELRDLGIWSGNELVSLAQKATDGLKHSRIDLTDGYRVEPWVIITQAINHATEHREQIKSILTSLGIEPPRIDGWLYGRQNDALIAPEQG